MVQLRRITKRFGTLTAVDHVDLTIGEGEFLTLLGPSGCGKTTLLRTISGFETPDEGDVLLDGHDVTSLPPYRRDVNQVFQSYALFPHMTVWDNMAFGLRMRRLSRTEIGSRIDEALRMVNLAGLESRKPAQLSGGQQQRVALARAIVCRPKVLLLDEPLAALDARLRQAMRVELKHLQQRLGITFVFVTHDQDEALVMSDRIAVMNRGRIEQLAAPAEIYLRPATDFVAGFVGQANVWPARVTARDGATTVLTVENRPTLHVVTDKIPSGADRVRVLVRPENVHVSATADRPNAFAATVVETFFSGPTIELRLKTATGLELIAVRLNAGPAPLWQTGSTVYCSVDPADVVLIP